MAGKSRSMFRRKGNLGYTLLVFFICLLISALFWILLAFNGYYNTNIRVPVTYINMPADNFLHEKLPEEIELEIAGEGYRLLTYLLWPEKASLVLNGYYIGMSADQARSDAFLTLNNSIDYFNRLHNDVKAIRSNPDTIFFNFFKQGFRKVPLHLVTNLEFESGFGLSGNIKLSPDSIHISGPPEILEKVSFMETETLKLSGINQNQVHMVKILQPFKELDYAPVEAQVEIPVEKFTEVLFDIPLHMENLLNHDSVQISPSLIRLSCSIALSKYAEARLDSFVLAVDLRTLRGKKLKVNIRKHPSFVNNIRLSPDYVDCIVRKR